MSVIELVAYVCLIICACVIGVSLWGMWALAKAEDEAMERREDNE